MQTKVELKVPKKRGAKVKEVLKDSKAMSFIRRSHEQEVKLTNPTEFFEKINRPTKSKLYTFIEDLKSSTKEMMDTTGRSHLVEFDSQGRTRIGVFTNSNELRAAVATSEKNYMAFMKLREASVEKFLRSKEDSFGGFSDPSGSSSQFVNRDQFTPLIGTPFFKQMYLSDYWEMHSKVFWYKNYSAIAKMVIDMTRNFVLGKGFNIEFEDDKAEKAWKKYDDRNNIQESARLWCDELSTFGEVFLRKFPSPTGLMHRSCDPSTFWEIVTDPENIADVKYYHQQYNTQYQLYGTKDVPLSKYIINQIPPQLMIHEKINVTSYEKRGRSDLLAPLLYFKYYEDYMSAKLIRIKNESSFIWDVEIDGSDEDVQAYINSSESAVDVPAGSDFIHNKAIKRTPLTPTFGKASNDETAKDILSYVAMGVSIPVNYMGTFGVGGNSKAGALVATEPVAKRMVERQLKLEHIIRRVVQDVLVDAGLDPKSKFEINFPEIMEEDRSQKIQDLVLAKDEQVISHKKMSLIIAKELKITKYDYDEEQKEITNDSKNSNLFIGAPDLTADENPEENNANRGMDRPEVKKQGHSF